jgi:hypothetical protein
MPVPDVSVQTSSSSVGRGGVDVWSCVEAGGGTSERMLPPFFWLIFSRHSSASQR